MAFDQNPLPKDLHPLNIVRNAAEDPRLDPVTSSGRPIEGVHTTPLAHLGGSPAVYYPPMVLDAAFVHLGFNNGTAPGVSGLAQHVMSLQQHQTSLVGPTTVNHPGGGYGNSPSFGPPAAGSDLDNVSKNGGGDDSASGHKIKFLCSFGGKILPRLSDGALRYVGGQTRIISVRRDVGFNEFVKKMTDTCAQDSVVKYQLPDGDLDALVSVSCPDDLENMMDEYEKLVERCPDGSGKLRIFLFRPSDIDYEDFAGVGDVQAGGGQTYVQAVNGISDGFSGNSGNSSCIARKESIESVVSGQNSSDLNDTEGGDGLSGNHLGEVIGVPSGGGLLPKRNYVHTEPVSCTEPSLVQTGIPVVRTGPGISKQEVERCMPVNMATQAPHDVSYEPTPPYMQAYWDPQQENTIHPNFVQNPAEIGYPANILAPVRPFYTQPRLPIPAGVSSQQFNPAMHLTKPAFMGMNPSAAHAVIQPQHVKDHFTLERVVEISADQGYCACQTQVPVQGDANNWHQVPILDQTAYSEGGLPPQQSVVLVEKVPRFKDCHMCQKTLPHVHSDTIALERNEVPAGTLSDLRSNYWSVHFDGQGRPMIRPVVPIIENSVEQLAGGSHLRIMGNTDDPEFRKIQMEGITGVVQNVEGPSVNDKAVPQKVENPDALKATLQQGFMVTSGVQYPYSALVANPPPSGQPNCVPNFIVQPQLQVKNDFSPAGIQLQTKDYVLHESPTSYVVKVSGGVPMDEHTSSASGHLRQIEERLENLHLRPSEVLSNNEHNKVVKVPIKEDMHNLMCGELYEMTEPPPVGNPNMYPYSAQGINQSHPNDSSENTVYPSSDPLQAAEQVLPASEWKDNNTAWPQSKITGFGDVRGDSTLLYTYFLPTKSSKFQIRKDMGPREDNRVLNTCKQRVLPLESPQEDGGHQHSSNREFGLDHNLSSEASSTPKGSAEELIKQELQVVAEGAAASVLHSSGPSNPDTSSPITQQNIDVQPANVEIQQKDKLEEIKTKLSDKINSGFPASGMGRLQIIRNNDLEELRELGSGTFGTVYHGKWRGTDVAIKRINERCFAGKPSEQDHMREDFWNEAIKLADLHHPNVVAFYGVVLDGPDGSVATVTEFMVNGSLRNALQKSERNLDKRKRLLIGMDVAFGMEYLHGKNIVHFDLKSDNLLVNLRDPHRPICKVGDLGLSKVKCKTLISGGVRGTLPWMAPELLNGSSSLVSEKVDVFSFGIVMWELLTGKEPYADLHYGAIIGGIVSNTLRPPVPETCDPDWRALMETCWSSKPSERPTFAEIANELRAMAMKPKGPAQ